MFDSLFPKEWTTLQRLMWLKTNALARAVYETVTGNPVSFTAKAAPLRQLEVAFSPVQSLNGYDAPWPAGGGKNLLYQMPTTSQTINGVAWSINADGSITANGTATGDSTFFYITDTSGIGYSFDGDYKYKNFGYVSTSIMKIGVKIGNVWKTVYSNSYSDVSDVHGQIKQMWFQIRDGQTANNIAIYPLFCKASETEPTAWTPYSNLCPISGWDSLNVEQRGKNLLHGTEYSGIFYGAAVGADLKGSRSGTSYEQSDNEITVTAGGWTGCVFATDLLPAGTYHIGFSASSTNARTSAFITDNDLIVTKNEMTWGGGSAGDRAVTLSEAARIVVWAGCASAGTATITSLQVEIGSTASEYQPYTGRSISINIGQTVYSGYVDVCTGQGEIDRTDIVFDGSADENWMLYTFGSAEVKSFRIFVENMKNADVQNYIAAEWLRNQTAGWASLAEWTISVAARYFYCRADSTIVTVEAWKAYLAEHPLKATYPLATPIPIQLTPQEVESLAGDNTMWTDGDSLEVTYRSN